MPRAGRLSRETRLLAATIAVSVLVLLVLGRFRFPAGADVMTDAIQAQPLARLASRAAFDDLSLALTQLNGRVVPSLVVLRVSMPGAADAGVTPPPITVFVPAIRVRDDTALTRLPEDARVEGAVGAPGAVTMLGVDPVRELALVRIPSQPAQVLPMREGAAPLGSPGYVAMAAASPAGVALQPLFVGRSDAQLDPRWDTPVVTLGPGSRADAGAPIFTLDGRLAGMATTTDEDGTTVLIPADALMASVEQMLSGGVIATGDLGVETQALDARTARVTGALGGSVIASVAADGPSNDRLWVGDIVTAVNGQPIATPRALQWRIARTTPGTTVSLTVLRSGTYLSVPIVVGTTAALAAATVGASPSSADAELGLTLRAVAAEGAEVVRVRTGSAADAAGILAGDVITAVGRTRTPTPAEVTEAWNAQAAGTPLFLGVVRNARPHALVIEK